MFDDDDSAEELQADKPGCVYFLSLVDPLNPNRDFGLVKVGITKGAVETRIGHLQTGNPYRIQIEGEIRTPVAQQLERWLHSTEEVAHLEWLRVTRDRVGPLIERAKAENERFCEISNARAHWVGMISNGTERPCSSEEARIFEDARGVLEDYWSTFHQWRLNRLHILVTAGAVGRIPGIIQNAPRPSLPKFNQRVARELFGPLVERYTADRVRGNFRWAGLATEGAPQFATLRSEADDLEGRARQLHQSMLNTPEVFQHERPRTDALIELHEKHMKLFNRLAFLRVDREYLKALVIQRLQDCDRVAGVCTYKRQSRPVFDSAAFRANHRPEAMQSSPLRKPFVYPRVFPSRSY